MDEIQKSGVDERVLWQSWHGDSHLIADDKKNWKKHCPTFAWVVEKLASYFDMNVQATRLNWYRDSNEWKPFHHDAAAVKPDKVKGTVRKINHILQNVLTSFLYHSLRPEHKI